MFWRLALTGAFTNSKIKLNRNHSKGLAHLVQRNMRSIWIKSVFGLQQSFCKLFHQ